MGSFHSFLSNGHLRWKLNINTNLTTAQFSSDSWSGEETGSFNWAAQFAGIAEKPFSEQINSRTT